MKGKAFPYILTIAGAALLATGLYLLKAYPGSQGLLQTLPYYCIGFGCGVFGHGAGELISRRTMKKHPEAAKQQEIAQRDERNVAIRNAAQAKAYNIMIPVFGALLVSFGLMGVDVAATLMLVAAYLFVCGCSIYYRIKFEKEM